LRRAGFPRYLKIEQNFDPADALRLPERFVLSIPMYADIE
jgi:hypothetical protein